MCLEDFLQSATRLRISELPHIWTWGEYALDLGRHINHHVAHKELMLQSWKKKISLKQNPKYKYAGIKLGGD